MRTCMVLIVVAGALAIGQFVAVGKVPNSAHREEVKVALAAQDPAANAQRGADYIAAFNAGDAKAVAAFWTPDGDYIDQAGQQHKGRPAIEKLYAKVFAENKGAKLAITVTAKKPLGADVVLEDGITEVTLADGSSTLGRFSAVLVKKENVWYFESVRETIARPASNVEHFDGIAWLVGDWASEVDKGEAAVASYSWAENQNFIVSSFATTVNGVPMVGGTQWISYDAVDKTIRSTTFYSGGGTGEAVWSVNGNTITIKSTVKTAAGNKATMVNVVTKVDADHATFQATQIVLDGKPQPDGPVLKLKRVKEPTAK